MSFFKLYEYKGELKEDRITLFFVIGFVQICVRYMHQRLMHLVEQAHESGLNSSAVVSVFLAAKTCPIWS